MRDYSGWRSRSFAADSICRRWTGSISPTRGWSRSAPIARTSSERASRPQTRRTTASRRRCTGIPCSRRSMLAPVVVETVSRSGGVCRVALRFPPGGNAELSIFLWRGSNGRWGETPLKHRKNDVEIKSRLIYGGNYFTNICKTILRVIDGKTANMI